MVNLVHGKPFQPSILVMFSQLIKLRWGLCSIPNFLHCKRMLATLTLSPRGMVLVLQEREKEIIILVSLVEMLSVDEYQFIPLNYHNL